jgi:hypothetical protein
MLSAHEDVKLLIQNAAEMLESVIIFLTSDFPVVLTVNDAVERR